nr:GNAT family N-acetyltransferase [Paenibacillus luteus]
MQSVLECNSLGWVFSDRVESPKTALVWCKGMNGFYLIGDESNDDFTGKLDDFITTSITPKMKELGMNEFEVSGHHDKWNLHSLFASRELNPWDQMVYVSSDSESHNEEPSNGFQAVKLGSQEWRSQEFLNSEFVYAHINQFWETHEDFYEKGYGYVAIKDFEIIGVCYSSFVTKKVHAIGIETLPQHHKRGVGTCLASLVAKDIAQNGYSSYWDCSQSNEASRKLALRLGFRQFHLYQCVSFSL